MLHPKGKSSRFNEDLLPKSIDSSIEAWLLQNLITEGSLRWSVHSLLYKFRKEFKLYVNKADQVQIPAMMKACKQRASLLSDFCQKVIVLLHKGYLCYPITKDYQLIESNFKIRFAKSIMAYDPNEQMEEIVEEIDITNNPKMYRHLYYMVLESLMRTQCREDIYLICLIAQSEGYIFESVEFTPEEIVAAEEEFLQAAEEPDCWNPTGELATLMDEVISDMRKPKPPLYIADFKQVRRSHDGYRYGHPWTIDDGWYSTKSSGSQLIWNGRKIPNIGLLFSALEVDHADPIDDSIGYKSLYPNEPFPGLVQETSTTLSVPKTSSRGRRFIHPEENGRQDRGSYVDNMTEYTVRNVVKCDTTYPPPGKDGTEFARSFTPKDNRVLVCTDMEGSTDHISHQFLKKFWDAIFPEGFSDFLLRIHSGEGLFKGHSLNERGELTNKEFRYVQISGIKCGTKSNFNAGLTLPHNFIHRCVFKKLKWEDRDPADYYVVHGDDDCLAIPVEEVELYVSTYVKLAAEAGFRVHPLNKKGMISYPTDYLYRAEYNKQVWAEGLLISRIPHRLFFADDTIEKKFQVILWLSQYKYLNLNGADIKNLLLKPYFENEVVYACWNFLVDKKLFGIPSHLKIQTGGELVDRDQYYLALQIFIQSLSVGMYDVVLNNRQRLSEELVKKKVKEHTLLFNDTEFLDAAIQWQNEHCLGIGKLEYTITKNQKFADELMTVFKDPFIWGHTLLGFFSLKEKEIIGRCLPHARVSLDPDLEMIDLFLEAAQVLKRTQPHSISKRTRTSSSTIIKTLREYLNGMGYLRIYSEKSEAL